MKNNNKKKINAVLEVTKRCDLRCKTCFAWRVPHETNELTIEEWKDVVNSISKTFDHDVSVTFGGGEPFLKEGILDVVDLCFRNGYETNLSTNAFSIDKDMAKKIVDSGLNNLFLSLNSLDEQVHDFLKGTKGSYRRVMEAIDYVAEYKKRDEPRIIIGSLITDMNLDDMIDLTKWVSSNNKISGITFQAITTPFYTREDNTWYNKSEYNVLWPQDKDKVKEIIENLIKFKQEGHKIITPASQLKTFINYYTDPQKFVKKGECHLGYGNFSVGSDGYVFLCFLMEPIDNIRSHDFAEIWNSARATQIRQRIKQCKKNCQILINCWFDEV